MDQIKIGKFISSLRKEHNMTQLVLADKLGVSDRAISKWENGRGLPEVSLMKPLCEILGITLDELLCGERIEKSDVSAVSEQNIINVLFEREKEIRKRKCIRKIYSLLLTAVIIFGCVFGLRLIYMTVSGIIGEGNSIYTAIYTRKAERAVKLILTENFEKAVKYIGFENQDKGLAQNCWVGNMKLLENDIDIELFEISEILLDDGFPAGEYFIVAFDRSSGTRYLFDGQFTIQDGGIAFGSVYLPSENKDIRRKEVAGLIEKALCSWYAG